MCTHNRPQKQSTSFLYVQLCHMCAHIHKRTAWDTLTCSGICSHGWINRNHTHTDTNAHTHICACIDHLLTLLCNSSTCLGLRLLFPSKKLTMSGLGRIALESPPPHLCFCPHSLPTSVSGFAWSPALYSLTKNNLCCFPSTRDLTVIASYLTANLPFKINHRSLFLQPFHLNPF